MHVTRPPPHPNSWHKFIDQWDNKKKQKNSPLNIISVICKERWKHARKYLQTGCATYRLDLSFCRMLLDALGLLNLNDFSHLLDIEIIC